MINHFVLLAVFVAFVLTGCATGGDIDVKSKQLRDEIYAEMRMRIDNLRDDFKRELKEVGSQNKQNLKEVGSQNKQNFETLTNKVQTEITRVNDMQKKYTLESDKALMEQQKQILQNKLILDDTARRVYMLESIVSAKAPDVFQVKEGYVTFVESNRISTSLGSINGVRLGDLFGIYRNKSKVAVIQMDTVEMNSSKGVVINMNKEETINVGDKIEIEKGT